MTNDDEMDLGEMKFHFWDCIVCLLSFPSNVKGKVDSEQYLNADYNIISLRKQKSEHSDHSSQYVASANQCLIRIVKSLERWNLKKVKVNGFKCIQVHSKHGNFRKTEMIILSLNMSLNTIFTDIYVFRVDPSNSD